MYRGICETPDEFVDVPDALNRSQGAPIPDEQCDELHVSGDGAIYTHPPL